MTILGIEFSSAQRSVALARDGSVLAEAVESGGYRATNAFGLIQQVLAKTGISRDSIEGIAVGLGPGSYTGIRSAIALAQGWQLARDIKLLGISSAESLAVVAKEKKLSGKINVVIDAQRGEYYLSGWDITPSSCQVASPLRIVSSQEIENLSAKGETCVGPDCGIQVFPSAKVLAQLAAQRKDFLLGKTLEPIYLRETTFVKAPPARAYF